MIGEALRCETYHTGKTRQENFIRKIWINTIRLRNLESGNSRKSFTKKPDLVGLIAPALAQRFQRVLIFSLEEPIIGRSPGNRKRRRSFRDLENHGCAAYFMRCHQKRFAIWAVLFLDK